MFRGMRRKKQQLLEEDILFILNNENAGVLSLFGDDGYPYGVPISYVYFNEKIYFHSAKTGHKIDSIKRNYKASFTVISKNDIVPEKYTTKYRSVIAFGRVRIIENIEEMYEYIYEMSKKFNPNGSDENHNYEIEKGIGSMVMIEFTIEDIKGKEGLELLKERDK